MIKKENILYYGISALTAFLWINGANAHASNSGNGGAAPTAPAAATIAPVPVQNPPLDLQNFYTGYVAHTPYVNNNTWWQGFVTAYFTQERHINNVGVLTNSLTYRNLAQANQWSQILDLRNLRQIAVDLTKKFAWAVRNSSTQADDLSDAGSKIPVQ